MHYSYPNLKIRRNPFFTPFAQVFRPRGIARGGRATRALVTWLHQPSNLVEVADFRTDGTRQGHSAVPFETSTPYFTFPFASSKLGTSLQCHWPMTTPFCNSTTPGLLRIIVFRVVSSQVT